MYNKPNRYSHQKQHNSYGIKNWLFNKGWYLSASGKWINDKDYIDLLKEFAYYTNLNFEYKNDKALENYVQKNFNKFRKYCNSKIKTK